MKSHITDYPLAGSIESSFREAETNGLISSADFTSKTTAKAAVDTALGHVNITQRGLGNSIKGAIDKAEDVAGVTFAVGVKQKETLTVAGTVGASGAGDAKVTVTSKKAPYLVAGYEIAVAVANNDSASTVGGKVRTALNADTKITDFFTVSGSGANVILEEKTASENDSTFNIAIDNDTSTGLTTVASSANTTAGVNSIEKVKNAVTGDFPAGFPVQA